MVNDELGVLGRWWVVAQRKVLQQVCGKNTVGERKKGFDVA
jgi:hypothetical protein